MREAAVCKNLQQWLASGYSSSSSSSQATPAAVPPEKVAADGDDPLVFGVLSSHSDHGTATLSLNFKFYAYHPTSSSCSGPDAAGASSSSCRNVAAAVGQCSPHFTAVELHVQNLGQAGLAAPAAEVPLSVKGSLLNLPALAAVVAGRRSGGSEAINNEVENTLLDVARTAVPVQLSAVEGLYEALLDKLQLAVGQVQDTFGYSSVCSGCCCCCCCVLLAQSVLLTPL